jgi:hypothetical protein
MLTLYKKNKKKITHLSGPISFHYLVPKNRKTFLPLLMLLGDKHGSEDESGKKHMCPESFQCSEKVDCISTNKSECCFSLSNVNFLKVLSEQTDFYYPIDIYTEHWSHEYDVRDEEITYYGSELDRIDKTLKKLTRKGEKRKTINLDGKHIRLMRVKTKEGKDDSKRKKCVICGKLMTEKKYYVDIEKKKYHIKCTNNIRWQSSDVRRSFLRSSIENELSNIYWEFDNPDYQLKQYHIYLIMSMIRVNGSYLINESYDKDKTYVFPEIKASSYYEIDTDHFSSLFFDSITEGKFPIMSIIYKEMIRSGLDNKEMWKRVYNRSTRYYGYNLDRHFTILFLRTIYDKIYHSSKIKIMEGVLDTILFPIIQTISPMLDIYTLLRVFHMSSPSSDSVHNIHHIHHRFPVLNIIYTGGYHSLNFYYLLTSPDKKYPDYSIDFYTLYSSKKNKDDVEQRCLTIDENINLYEDISSRKNDFIILRSKMSF